MENEMEIKKEMSKSVMHCVEGIEPDKYYEEFS
jgi:hypothetical protein